MINSGLYTSRKVRKWGVCLPFFSQKEVSPKGFPAPAEEFPKTRHTPTYRTVSCRSSSSNLLGQTDGSEFGNSPHFRYGYERLLPLVFLVDGGRNGSVGFRPPCVIRNNATTKFHQETQLGMRPSLSLVVAPPRRKSVLNIFPPFSCSFSRALLKLYHLQGVSSYMLSGRIGENI